MQSGQRSKSCVSNNSKTTEANLMKFHRKIEHSEKVCCAQELGFYAQGQGNNQVRGQIAPNRKVKQNDNLRPVQDFGSLAVFKVKPGISVIIRGLRGHLLHSVTFLVF